MDVKGFAIQLAQMSQYNTKEEISVITYCILKKIPYKFCKKPEDRPEGFIPMGQVEWCDAFLPHEKTIPDYYPEFLKDHLFRRVWKTDIWPMTRGIFVKPADRHKRFTGFVTLGGYRKKKRGPYWCSEIVNFINEWRYYVAEGKILVGEWYDGDQEAIPDAPELKIDIPADYCGALDFGTLKTGEVALIEANSPYACGWYGNSKNNDLYVEWLIKGWEYLNETNVIKN